ncbi:MAG TPA: hypothetical protein VIY48_09750 [Candidatus Paceibacterota bacterium]
MRILDYGAGWKAIHARGLRDLGYEVVAHDFGRNFDPAVHDAGALSRVYDVVYASNVLNVQCTTSALARTLYELASVVEPERGFAVVNYPTDPRKMPGISAQEVRRALGEVFWVVGEVPKQSCPVWECWEPIPECRAVLARMAPYTAEEIERATIRPSGAVGAGALVPRIVVAMLGAMQ